MMATTIRRLLAPRRYATACRVLALLLLFSQQLAAAHLHDESDDHAGDQSHCIQCWFEQGSDCSSANSPVITGGSVFAAVLLPVLDQPVYSAASFHPRAPPR